MPTLHSCCDDCQAYPVVLWVIQDYYEMTKLHLDNRKTFRDFTKPIKAHNAKRCNIFDNKAMGCWMPSNIPHPVLAISSCVCQNTCSLYKRWVELSGMASVHYRSVETHFVVLQNQCTQSNVPQSQTLPYIRHPDVKDLIPDFVILAFSLIIEDWNLEPHKWADMPMTFLCRRRVQVQEICFHSQTFKIFFFSLLSCFKTRINGIIINDHRNPKLPSLIWYWHYMKNSLSGKLFQGSDRLCA